MLAGHHIARNAHESNPTSLVRVRKCILRLFFP